MNCHRQGVDNYLLFFDQLPFLTVAFLSSDLACAIPTGCEWGNAIGACSDRTEFAVVVFVKTLPELSGEQRVDNNLWMEGGRAHTLPAHSSFLETEKLLFISLLWTRIKEVLLKGIPWQGLCFSPQMQYFAGQIRTRGGGVQSTWPSTGY